MRDIHELTATIERLERERDAAENFAALAAHELMAPLVMTEACVALAAERLDAEHSADVLEALGILGRGAGRTRHLVETLLHEARASSRPVRRDVIDLNRLTADCLAMVASELEARDLTVTVGPLPSVRGEAELLGGVMTNLLTNAIKFNHRSGGAIDVAGKQERSLSTISVTSTGAPLARDDALRIFEPFHRGRRERRIQGAGLGLAICRRIVERHGGSIGVQPTETGNRFYFTLPA